YVDVRRVGVHRQKLVTIRRPGPPPGVSASADDREVGSNTRTRWPRPVGVDHRPWPLQGHALVGKRGQQLANLIPLAPPHRLDPEKVPHGPCTPVGVVLLTTAIAHVRTL